MMDKVAFTIHWKNKVQEADMCDRVDFFHLGQFFLLAITPGRS